uniref:Ig-like domain-containing protein n=1 Tax=Esox lucius TaxID=8010 RepID=A0A3P8XHK4_ESOLU
ETVTLTCSVGSYIDWRYKLYKDSKDTVVSQSNRHTVTGDTLTIKRAAESDQGLYWCQGERDSRPKSTSISQPVSITVNVNQLNVTLISDQKEILTGDSVTLTCTVESSGWRFYWYRHRQDSEPVATTSGSSYTLSQVSVSDGGQYRCRAGRGDPVYYTQYSEPVNIQVTVTGSSTSVLVGVVVGPVVAAVLLTVFLVLLCRYKKSK